MTRAGILVGTIPTTREISCVLPLLPCALMKSDPRRATAACLLLNARELAGQLGRSGCIAIKKTMTKAN